MGRAFLKGKNQARRIEEEKRAMKTCCAQWSVIETNTIIVDDDGWVCFLFTLTPLRLLSPSFFFPRYRVSLAFSSNVFTYIKERHGYLSRSVFFCVFNNDRLLSSSRSVLSSSSSSSFFSVIVFSEREEENHEQKNDLQSNVKSDQLVVGLINEISAFFFGRYRKRRRKKTKF